MKRLPPIEKIFEAYSAIADGRVDMHRNALHGMPATITEATVKSSDGKRVYTVTHDNDAYTSNDNATYWQGYPGYPVIAVMMMEGLLPVDKEIMSKFAGVNWKEVNTRHKNDYRAAVEDVMASRGLDPKTVWPVVQELYSRLGLLPCTVGRGTKRPPRAS